MNEANDKPSPAAIGWGYDEPALPLTRDELEPLPDEVQAFADVDELGQLRLGAPGDQLAVLPLPAPAAEPTCPDCGGPWRPGSSAPACPSCGLTLEDLEAAAAFLDRL